MGWLSMQSMGAHATPKAYLDAQFTWQNETGSAKVLRSSIVGRSTYYAAVERRPVGDADPVVFGLICLIKYTPRARDGYVFAYKDMDETVGPYQRQCPGAILDLLTPTDYPYAIAWRADCRRNLADRRIRSATRPKIGDTLVLASPVLFRDGKTLSRFRAVRLPMRRGLVYHSLEAGGYYRIPNIGGREFRIEPAKVTGAI